MKLAALVSCAARNLTAAQREALEARVEFVEPFPRRNGRMLLSCVAERADLQWLLDRMTAANLTPVLLAAFRSDNGKRIAAVPINRAEWLNVAPDVWNPATDPELGQEEGDPAENDDGDEDVADRSLGGHLCEHRCGRFSRRGSGRSVLGRRVSARRRSRSGGLQPPARWCWCRWAGPG